MYVPVSPIMVVAAHYILKQIRLDDSDSVSCRPISWISCFLNRILPHVPSSPNCNPLQSAHLRRHSTETALLKWWMSSTTLWTRADLPPWWRWTCRQRSIRSTTMHFCSSCSTRLASLELRWIGFAPTTTTVVHISNGARSVGDIDVGYWRTTRFSPEPAPLHVVFCSLVNVTRSVTAQHHQYVENTSVWILTSKEKDTGESIPSNTVRTLDIIGCFIWGFTLYPLKAEVIQFNVIQALYTKNVAAINVTGTPISLYSSHSV